MKLVPFFLVFFVLFMVILAAKKYHYKLQHHHVEIPPYNREYFSHFALRNSKYNRTTTTFSGEFTLLKDLNELFITVQPFLYVSNEYRNFAPVRFTFSLCKAFDSGLMGFGEVLPNSNLTHCPLKKGYYYVKDFRPNEDQYPANMPYGTYRFYYIISTVKKIQLVTIEWYGSVDPINATAG